MVDWNRLDEIFDGAVERTGAEREAWVAAACGEDAELRRQVDRLLEADRRAGDFLERPLGRFEVAGAEAANDGDDDATERVGPDVVAGAGAGLPGRIGPYRILRSLSRGGMGDVYLAARADDEFNRLVALKLVRTGLDGEVLRRRLRLERQILAQLEHPYIARLYDGGTTEGGQPYLVMELVEGENVDRYCDSRRLGIEARLRLFLKICEAVAFAHKNLVVHRDLKPPNILVAQDGEPRLLDFGIAKLLDEETDTPGAAATQLTHTGERLMTPSYASPEQVRGESVNTATDVYSLGVLLYRLLTGRSPYGSQDKGLHEVERAILEHQPERPSAVVLRPVADTEPAALAAERGATARELSRRLRGDLDTIVARALDKDPERRYASVRELAEDVERHLELRPVLARPDRLGYRLGKLVRRHTLAVVGVTAFAALLVGFSAVTSVQAARIARERDTAREQREHAELERSKAQLVSDFMLEIFEEADPGRTAGEAVTVRELLDRAAESVDALRGQPQLQAIYLRTIGEVYDQLGLWDQAVQRYEEALRLLRGVPDGSEGEIAKTLRGLGTSLASLNDFERALEVQREALAISRLLPEDERPMQVLDSLSVLALNLSLADRFEEAAAASREALEVAASVKDGGGAHLGRALRMQVIALERLGDYERAEAFARRALEVAEADLGPDHPDTSESRIYLAYILRESARYEEAEALYRQGLEFESRVFGPGHSRAVAVRQELAVLLTYAGKYDEARAELEQVLAEQRRLYGDESREVARAIHNLALVLFRQGEYAAAEPLLYEARDLLLRLLGDEDHSYFTSLTFLGVSLSKQGRYEEAVPIIQEALALARRLAGDDHDTVASCLTYLAEIDLAQGDPAAAEAGYRRALEIFRNTFGQDHPKVASSLAGLATALADQGDYAAAEASLREAVEVQVRVGGEEHPEAARYRAQLEELQRRASSL